MPEGPTIVILRGEVAHFTGQRILAAEGNSRIDLARLVGQSVTAFRSWGKHFLIELPGFAIRVHFLMFGSYNIDTRKGSRAAPAPHFPERRAEPLQLRDPRHRRRAGCDV